MEKKAPKKRDQEGNGGVSKSLRKGHQERKGTFAYKGGLHRGGSGNRRCEGGQALAEINLKLNGLRGGLRDERKL